MSALHFAARTDQFDSVNMLIASGCNVDPEDNWKRTPLYMAILNNQLRMIVCLLSYGASIQSIMTPLQVAVKRGYRDVVKILLHHGVNVNTQDQFGKKLLHTAIYQGDEFMVRYLLKQG
jgi:ankyrin repeat protein